MQQQPFLDNVKSPLLALIIVAVLAASAEIGFQWAHKRGRHDQASHTSVVVAALLAMLGLLLAFCFSIVEARFSTRKMLVIDEANAIGTTYLRASMLPPDQVDKTRALLRRYAETRLNVRSVEAVAAAIPKAEAIQHDLWDQATTAARDDQHDVLVALFVASLNQMIDLHLQRITVALHHRLPQAMLSTLGLLAVLALAAYGYSAGLEHVRAPMPLISLVLAVAAVLIVIVELDRPYQRLFIISQDALEAVHHSMAE